jgi:hypothetical protein
MQMTGFPCGGLTDDLLRSPDHLATAVDFLGGSEASRRGNAPRRRVLGMDMSGEALDAVGSEPTAHRDARFGSKTLALPPHPHHPGNNRGNTV